MLAEKTGNPRTSGTLPGNSSFTVQNSGVPVSTEKYSAISKMVGKPATLFMYKDFPEIHILGLSAGSSLPVRILAEFDRFFTVEVTPHSSVFGQCRVPYRTNVSKYDIDAGRAKFVINENGACPM